MAISGGATTAYTYTPYGSIVTITPTTRQRGLCLSPADAVAAVLAGDAATVAGSDAPKVRELLAQAGREVQP